MIIAICDEPQEVFGKICKATESVLGLTGEAELELVFADADEIRRVNRETRGIDSVTDVLSFPALNEISEFTRENYPYDTDPISGRVTLGSVMICREQAARQAEEIGHGTDEELAYLFTHGLLHLLGFDHMEKSDKQIMRTAEENILRGAGIMRGEYLGGSNE